MGKIKDVVENEKSMGEIKDAMKSKVSNKSELEVKEVEGANDKLAVKESMYVPPYVFSFQELFADKQAKDKMNDAADLADQFYLLSRNIIDTASPDEVEAKLGALTSEYSALVKEVMNKKEKWQPLTNIAKKAISTLKDKISHKDDGIEEFTGGSFQIKEQSDGSYRWLAIYSNKFRDDDYPSEIISEKSHKRFDEMLAKGEAPMPELWYWHVPGTRWGVADFHAYDDSGFAIAGGTVDKGFEHIAKEVSKRDDLLVSHGMPLHSLAYDEKDNSVIVEHMTMEISPLPATKAANKLTGFVIVSEDKNMALAKEKKDELAALGFDADGIEQSIASKAKAAKGIEFKEKEEKPNLVVENTDEVVEDEAVDEAVEKEAKPVVEGVSREELTAVVTEMGAALRTITDAVGALTKEVSELKNKEADEPVFDLRDIFQSAIGTKEARVDGRSALAKDQPEHNKEVEQRTSVNFLNNLMSN